MIKKKFFDAQIETMARRDLERVQLHRLRWQIRRCYDGSQFYRDKFHEAGIKPKDIRSLEDVAKLPVVGKEELREEQAKHPPFGRYVVANKKNWRELHPSTGTTGIPVNTIWSHRDIETITAFTARTMWNFGTRPGDIVQNAFSYGIWIAGLSVHYAAKRLGCLIIPMGAGGTSRQIDFLTSPGATVMTATPSYALYIAEKMKERGVSPDQIALERGCFGGEPGTEVVSTRKRIEEGLGIEAYDYYGLAEIGPTIASECEEKAGLHWTEDHHLIEVIDPDTMERCAPGERGILVITHLSREATPMIRYWTNDYARLDFDKCACGRTHARSPGGITGREDDMLIYKGAKFYPVQVERVVRSHGALGDEFRIEFTRDTTTGIDVCTIIVECLDEKIDAAKMAEQLQSCLKEELLVTPEVRVVKSRVLERTEFKAKRVVDRRRN